MPKLAVHILLFIFISCSNDDVNVNNSIPLKSQIPFEVARDSLNAFFNNPRSVKLVISNTNLITMISESIESGMDVFVDDGKIERIQKTGGSTDGYQVVDGSDKYLIPGLADMHTHVIPGNDLKYDLFLFLAQGVTTLRVMWGFDRHINVRDSINSNLLVGPNVYVASAGFDGTSTSWPGAVNTSTTAEIMEKVDQYKAKGYDFIKIYSSIQSNQYGFLLDYAWQNDIPPVGHVPAGVDLFDAVSNGQYSIEHLGKYHSSSHSESELLQLTASSNVMIGPTLTVINRISSLTESYKTGWYWYVSRDGQAFFEQTEGHLLSSNSIYLQNRSLTGRIQQAGGKLLCGTDTGIRYVLPGISIHEELKSYAEAGISNYEVLKTSTVHPAEFLKDNQSGLIQEGFKADLVLLENSPLEQIENTERIVGVIKSGQWMSAQEIHNVLEYMRAFYSR